MRGGLYGLAVVVVIVATVMLGSWCLDDRASGWSSLHSAFPAGDRRLLYDRIPTRFATVDAAGRHHEFGSGERRAGGQRSSLMEIGFDATAFWVRTRPGESGPSGALYVPWKSVRSCGDRIALHGVAHELVIEDEAFVAACHEARP
jgi:hypothetical protein